MDRRTDASVCLDRRKAGLLFLPVTIALKARNESIAGAHDNGR